MNQYIYGCYYADAIVQTEKCILVVSSDVSCTILFAAAISAQLSDSD